MTRPALASARRVVVKVGSSSLTSLTGGLDPSRLHALVDALAKRRAAGSQVVLVSSGAIAAGVRFPALPRYRYGWSALLYLIQAFGHSPTSGWSR